MKYFDFKRYKFSTIFKNINFSRYNFYKINKYLDFNSYKITSILKKVKIKKIKFNDIFNFKKYKFSNFLEFKKYKYVPFYVFIFKLPVIRMSHYLFIFFSIITIIFLFQKFHLNSKTNFITIILLLCIVFNISKNLLRINKNGFINNPYLMINAKVYNQTEKSLGSFKYYLGWYGKAPSGNTNLDGFKHKKILIFNTIYK